MDFLYLAGMVLCLLLIPIGLPGLWLIVGLGGLAWLLGAASLQAALVLLLIAGVAELLEFVIVQRMNVRYGGSTRAFVGALLGGFVGVVLGVPVPIVGSVIGGVLGTFAGAAIGAYSETKELHGSARVGWGTALGRVLAIGAKLSAGFAMITVAAFSLFRH